MLAKFSATQQKHTLNCLQHLKCTSEIICIFFVLFTNSKIQVYSRSRDASFRLTTCTYEVRERTECQMQLGVVGWLAGWLDGWMAALRYHKAHRDWKLSDTPIARYKIDVFVYCDATLRYITLQVPTGIETNGVLTHVSIVFGQFGQCVS